MKSSEMRVNMCLCDWIGLQRSNQHYFHLKDWKVYPFVMNCKEAEMIRDVQKVY